MTTEISSNPTSGDFGNVDIAGLVDALDLSVDEKAHFAGLTNEDQTAGLESDGVSLDGTDKEAVVEEEITQLDTETPSEEVVTEKPEVKTEGEEEDGTLSPAIQKRIDKLTAEKYAAKEENEALKAQLTQAQQKLQQSPVPGAPQASVPLANVNSPQELMRARELALTAKEWALMNPHGGEYPVQGKDGNQENQALDETQVRELLVKANRMLDRDIPARQAYLNEAQGHYAEAKRVYPHLFDAKNPDAILASQYLQQAPWLTNFPDWTLVLGDTITGYRMRTAKTAQIKSQVPTLTPDPTKAKIIGSPKGQAAGVKVRAVKSPAELHKSGKNELSLDEAATLLDAFLR